MAIICLNTLFLPNQTDAHDRFRFLQYPLLDSEDAALQPALFSAENGLEVACRGVAPHLFARTARQGGASRKGGKGNGENRLRRCGPLRPQTLPWHLAGERHGQLRRQGEHRAWLEDFGAG